MTPRKHAQPRLQKTAAGSVFLGRLSLENIAHLLRSRKGGGMLHGYYSGMSRAGLLHGLRGAEMSYLPTLQPVAAAVAPLSSGVADYVLSRQVGTQIRNKLLSAGVTDAVITKMLAPSEGRATNLDKLMQLAVEKGAAPLVNAALAGKVQSPLGKNMLAALQRPATKAESMGRSAADWMVRNGTGKPVRNTAMAAPVLAASAEAAIAGGLPMSTALSALDVLPDAGLATMGYADKTGLIQKAKGAIFRAGYNDQTPGLFGKALEVWSPATREVRQLGEDAARLRRNMTPSGLSQQAVDASKQAVDKVVNTATAAGTSWGEALRKDFPGLTSKLEAARNLFRRTHAQT